MPRRTGTSVAFLLLLVGLAGCDRTATPIGTVIDIDGSSTVYPLTEAVAEDFRRVHPGTRAIIGVSGTGSGLRRLCRGAVDIANASRPITAAEADTCAAAGIEFLELPVAHDGITVVVHPSNTWVDSLTVAELRRLWRHQAEGRLLRWSQLRAGWPDREIHLFGAGVASGTFDYFTGVVTGVPRDSRGDYSSSEDDNVLVQGVATDPGALGYFGYAYYEEHREYLRAIPIRADDSAPAVSPTPSTIRSGAYHPLSRPVFLYVSAHAVARPGVAAFVDYYVAQVGALAGDVGYVALDARVLGAVRDRVAARTTGSLFTSDQPALHAVALGTRLGVE